MSGQELTPSAFFSGSSRRSPMDERVSILEGQVQTVIERLSRFKSRTQGQLQQTEQEKWDVFEWINEADANLKTLNQKCEQSFGGVTGLIDALATSMRVEMEELLNKLKLETNNVRTKGERDTDKLKTLLDLLNKQCQRLEDKTGEEIRRESVEREALTQRIASLLDKKKEEEKEFKEQIASIVQGKQDDREILEKQIALLIDEKQDAIEACIKSAFESSLSELQATLNRTLTDHENKLVGMAFDMQEVKTEMAKAPKVAVPASSSSHPTIPIVPPTPLAPRHVSSVKWTKTLSKLRHKEVRNSSLFKSFQNASGMTQDELKLTLLQSLDGEAMQLISPIADSSTVDEIIERLLNRVRPSQSVLMRKLMEVKQRIRESVYDFGARFQSVSSELPSYSDSRIRDILIESLNDTWKMTARSIVMSDSTITVEGLLHKLMELEGTDAADRMEIDHVVAFKEPQYVEYKGLREVMPVVTDGRINWDEVKDPKALSLAWKQLMRSDRAFRSHCLSWINHKPSYPNQQRNGYRPPQYNRPRPPPQNRRIFNIERPDPESEHEICEDDVFEEVEHSCAVTKVVPKQSVKVLHRSSSTPMKKTSVTRSRRTSQKSYLATAISGLKNPPLMYLRAKLDGNACDALVDTGSQISIIPYGKTKKWGMGFDTSRKQLIAGFDGKESESMGVASVEVKLGGEKPFFHDFVVVAESMLIFGNDLMKARELVVDPAGHQILLKDDVVVPCHYVERPSNENQSSTSSSKWYIKSAEQVLVPPVVKDDVMLIPAGKSFALGAKMSKTLISPLTSSHTMQILDVNRLPPGIITNAGVWMKDSRLRLTITNTTDRSVMIGSRAAIAGVVVPDDKFPNLIDQAGKDREVKRV